MTRIPDSSHCMRTILSLFCFALLGCGGDPAPVARSTPSTDPAVSTVAAPLADEPASPSATPVASCEALARPCGGWVGCVHVRELLGGLPARYEAIGIEAGAVYVLRQRCGEDGVCDEMCDPASGTCRPGLIDEEAATAGCTRTGPPTRAAFFCEMVEGACVRHDLPASVVPGGRS